MPRQRDDEEDGRARDPRDLPEPVVVRVAAPPAADEQQEDERDAEREGDADGGARDDGQPRQRREAQVARARRQAARPRAQEQVEPDRELERIQRLGNHDPGEQEHPEAAADDEPGVEAGAFVEEPAAELVQHQHQADDRQRERQPRGEGVLPEQHVAGRHEPVVQRRLLEPADAIDVQHPPVVALHHRHRCQRVAAVGIVEQRRARRVDDVDADADGEQEENGQPAARRRQHAGLGRHLERPPVDDETGTRRPRRR